MGRLQYLERLALGRSAYQSGSADTDTDLTTSDGPNSSAGSLPSSTNQSPRYDFKGRPVNPETNAQKARLRHASNAILALVGVVERKENAEAELQHKIFVERTSRTKFRIRENNRGDEWFSFVEVVAWFALWWPTALVRRIQIGLYSTDLPFAQILRYEAQMLFGNGWQGILLGLLPGAGITILHKIIWQVLALIAEESVGAIQNWILVSDISRNKAGVLIRSLTIFVDVVIVAIDLLLLPLETYAFAHQLNIAPPVSWRPLLTTNLPSFFRTTYARTFSSPAKFMASPAPYLISYSFLTRDPSPEAPGFSDLTSLRLPSISQHPDPSLQAPPSVLRDPLGLILHQTWVLRERFMHFIGWNVHEGDEPGIAHGFETDVSYLVPRPPENFQMKAATHRSTSLARLPAMWLGFRVDMFLLRILLLPLEGMAMRKILQFFMSAGMSVATFDAGVGAMMPDLGSTLAGKAVNNGWRSAARRLSHLGLGMALNLCAETFFFGFVYGLVRRQGVGKFEWGRCGYQEEDERSGDVIASSEDENVHNATS
jgi:hypothetical protein